jgi:hypothetical protein
MESSSNLQSTNRMVHWCKLLIYFRWLKKMEKNLYIKEQDVRRLITQTVTILWDMSRFLAMAKLNDDFVYFFNSKTKYWVRNASAVSNVNDQISECYFVFAMQTLICHIKFNMKRKNLNKTTKVYIVIVF